MFERFTEQARRSLFFARYEASQLGSISITPDHLLLGVLREGEDIRDLIPAAASQAVRDEVLRTTGERPPIPTHLEIPFSHEAKDVLQRATREADSFMHAHIGTEHLMLALAGPESGVAGILGQHGIQPDTLRARIGDRKAPAPALPPPISRVNPAVMTPDARGRVTVQQLEVVVAFVRSIADEQSPSAEVRRLVEQICNDLQALKSAVSQP